MIKAKFSFIEVQMEGVVGDPVKLLQPAFSVAPERLHAIDMLLPFGEFVSTVVQL